MLMDCHNPYFNRWFSAILTNAEKKELYQISHNPYFNRWFSAIPSHAESHAFSSGHNPYFNRWFSAI